MRDVCTECQEDTEQRHSLFHGYNSFQENVFPHLLKK